MPIDNILILVYTRRRIMAVVRLLQYTFLCM